VSCLPNLTSPPPPPHHPPLDSRTSPNFLSEDPLFHNFKQPEVVQNPKYFNYKQNWFTSLIEEPGGRKAGLGNNLAAESFLLRSMGYTVFWEVMTIGRNWQNICWEFSICYVFIISSRSVPHETRDYTREMSHIFYMTFCPFDSTSCTVQYLALSIFCHCQICPIRYICLKCVFFIWQLVLLTFGCSAFGCPTSDRLTSIIWYSVIRLLTFQVENQLKLFIFGLGSGK
jgi:hypothetical protein